MSRSSGPHSKRHLHELANDYAPWPLGTDAMVRILAWPNYSKSSHIQKVLQAARRLFGHEDACLCLRYHSSVDIPLENAVANIETALQSRNEQQEINILIVDDDIPNDQWYRVGLTAFCSIGINEEPQSIRRDFINAQRSEIIFV